MQRREAIRNILLASASTFFITGCSDANVVELLSNSKLTLDSTHNKYLNKIAEAFLPLSNLKSKIENPADFIMTMLNDCHAPEQIQKFASGFESYKNLMSQSQLKIKSSKSDDVAKVVEKVLEEQSEPNTDLIFFINKTKNLAIRNLMSSEYYMTEYADYSLIPNHQWDGNSNI